MQLHVLLAACATLGLPAAAPEPAAAPAPVSAEANPTEIDIMELTGIDWGPGDALPDAVTAYDGMRVVIGGYMHQSIEDTTNRFPMVSEACQCTGLLMPHHFVDVQLGPNRTEPIPGRFEVVGTLSVGVVEDEDGFVKSVYRLRGRIY